MNITNFTSSWRDGLAFAALVHNHQPDAFDYDSLSASDPLRNLEVAFDAAGKAGVPALLDPEDVLVGPQPDHFSIMTYLSTCVLLPTAGNVFDLTCGVGVQNVQALPLGTEHALLLHQQASQR